MPNISISLYSPQEQSVWDNFVAQSKNGTFMLQRAFVEYHQDRFDDHSVLLWKGGKLLAVFPASLQGQTWYSHQGLSYGGLVWAVGITLSEVCECWIALLLYAEQLGITQLYYKSIPSYYHRLPSEEDSQILFWLEASLVLVESSTLIRGFQPEQWQARRRRAVRKGIRQSLSLHENAHWEGFWAILEENLMEKHQARPVHSLEEIKLLHQKFPENIRLLTACRQGVVLGGLVLFQTEKIIHTQYIASNAMGKKLHALDFLINYLLQHHTDFDAISLGVSSVRASQQVNKGLQDWKDGWGGFNSPHHHWLIDTRSWEKLRDRFC